MENCKDSKSLNLEVISNQGEYESSERRQLPRLSLTSEQFRLLSNHKIFSVDNVSVQGMGLWVLDQEDFKYFCVGMEIEGILNLRGEKFLVRAQVKNLVQERVGCEFHSLSQEALFALNQLLDPIVLGSELKPVPFGEVNTLWYHGPSGTDLIMKRSTDGRFYQFTLYVFEYSIQWDHLEGLSTGCVLVSSTQKAQLRGIVRLESLLVKPDVEPQSSKLEIAKKLILSSNLSQDLRNWCIRHLER